MLHPTFGVVVEEEVVEGGVRREGMRAETVSLPREEAQGTWVVTCVLGQVTLTGALCRSVAGSQRGLVQTSPNGNRD